jgi:uncharacterized membrane protein
MPEVSGRGGEFPWWIMFVVGAFLSWGCYVPTLHEGQKLLGGGKPGDGAMRAFLCVGVAYFVTAVLITGVLLFLGYESRQFDPKGLGFAFTGGVLGAAGALCIIFSIRNGGSPTYVAPLVFAGAPIVNAMVTLWWHPPAVAPRPIYYFGIVLAAVGAALVLFEKGQVEELTRQMKAQQRAAATAPREAEPRTPPSTPS